ncbi:MAG: hypothetical protein AAGA70_04820 [Pseudomonadota bacterium]
MTDLGLLEEDKARAEITIRRAMEAFDTTIEALQHAVSELKAEYRSGEAEVMRDLKAMNAAFQFAVTTEAKAREAVAKQTPAMGVGSLDLDAAREEIGLRLACLRAAGDD